MVEAAEQEEFFFQNCNRHDHEEIIKITEIYTAIHEFLTLF